nr:MAG TPA: hypothetical protein [Crassvirales sp.]
MKINEVIEKLNDAFKTYGDIPVNISTSGEAYEDDIEDIQANETGVTIYNY